MVEWPTIEVTEGDHVRLIVRSADGPHGVEIKEFKVKKAVPRAKPGDSPITIEFVASKAGTFPILCSEYCGNGHKDMTGTLVVQTRPRAARGEGAPHASGVERGAGAPATNEGAE